MNPVRLRAYLYLLGATFIWGVAAVVIKLTLQGIEPLSFLAYRFTISGVVGILFVIYHRRILVNLLKDKETLLQASLYGLLATSIALGFLFLGLSRTTVLNLSLIDLVAPLLAAIFGVSFLKEHFTRREKIGSAVALLGAFSILLGPLLMMGQIKLSFLGDIFLFLYILTDAISSIFLKKLLRQDFSALFLINFSFIIAFITIVPIAIFQDGLGPLWQTVVALPIQYHIGVWFMALVSGSLAYYLRALGQKTVEIGEAGLFGYLISVFAAPLAIIVLHENITLAFGFGSVIVIVGIIIAESKKKRYT